MENWMYYVAFGVALVVGTLLIKFVWPKVKDKIIFQMAKKFIEEAREVCADGKCEVIKRYALDALQAWVDKLHIKIDVDVLAQAVADAFEMLIQTVPDDGEKPPEQDQDAQEE